MDDGAPNWQEALTRMNAASVAAATGRVRYREPDDPPGDVHTISFWFRRNPGERCSLRIDDELGLRAMQHGGVTHLRDAAGQIQRIERSVSWYGPGDPRRMLAGAELGVSYSRPNDYSRPRSMQGESVEVEGRAGWRFVLMPPEGKEHDLAVAVDDATGCVLEIRSLGVDASATLVDLDTSPEPAESWFDYHGTTVDDMQREHDARAAHHDHLHHLESSSVFPTPRWWPTGFGLSLYEADSSNGMFVGGLETPSEQPILARWPIGSDEPVLVSARERRDGWCVHRWTDDRWHWAIPTTVPLDATDLAAVVASLTDG